MTETRDYLKKMCVVGEASAGKTSLIRRFVVDKFDDKYLITIGTKTTKKNIVVKDEKGEVNIKLIIWDLMGQSGFAEIQRAAFRGASGAFIVLDLSRRETYDSFHKWMFSLYKVTGDIPVVVMANKKDLKHTFGKEDLEKLVKEYGFPFYFTSAKTGENVNEAFHTLGKMMLKPWKGIDFSAQFSKALKFEKKKEEIPMGKLSVREAEDLITASFCDLLDDPEYAMAIIRKQFENAKVDFNKPTAEGLKKVAGMLIEAASDQVEAAKLAKEKKEYRILLRRIG